MKILIIGQARHGKDTLAEYLSSKMKLKFSPSSEFVANEIYPFLKEKYNYTSVKQCFEDRVNHRSEWFDFICDYNKDDKARLTKEILKTNDIYVGLRCKDELDIAKPLFDIIIYVDASQRCSPEPTSSCTITKWDGDIIITNDDTLEDFYKKVDNLISVISCVHRDECIN